MGKDEIKSVKKIQKWLLFFGSASKCKFIRGTWTTIISLEILLTEKRNWKHPVTSLNCCSLLSSCAEMHSGSTLSPVNMAPMGFEPRNAGRRAWKRPAVTVSGLTDWGWGSFLTSSCTKISRTHQQMCQMRRLTIHKQLSSFKRRKKKLFIMKIVTFFPLIPCST